MKKILFVILFAGCQLINAQSNEKELSNVLDSVIQKAQEISYYADEVNWEELSNKMHSAAEGATTSLELKPSFEILLNQLRDHHGQIRNMSDYSIVAQFTDHENSRQSDDRDYDPEVWSIVNDTESRFEYKMLPQQIAYLKVVAVGGNIDGQKEAERIRSAVEELSKKGANQWVLDLRYNGGGNINIMLAGLAPLLDTKTVASIQDKDGLSPFNAEIIKGNFWYAGVNVFPIESNPIIKDPKIAILLSRWTVSSAELVAVAFKGQERTRFFGEKTGGYTTNNSWEIIGDKIALVISTGIYSDRNGITYPEFVAPDQEVVFEVEGDTKKDTGINEAIAWLLKN